MTTASELNTNPTPQEHEGIVDPGMADEAALEQQMNAAFTQHQQKLEGQEVQQQPAQQEVPQQQQQSVPQDLAQQIEQTFQQSTETSTEESQQPAEQPPEESNDRVKYMQQLFKDTLGVDVGEAVQTMNSFNETAQGTMQQMQAMENKIALQQQRLDLMYQWGAEAAQLGTTPSELVNQRLAETTQVFSTLNEGLRTRIASQGSKGIIDLYNLIQKNRGVTAQQSPQTTVPNAGRANIANAPQGNQSDQNLSDVISMKSDDDFWNSIRKGYHDDLGIRR